MKRITRITVVLALAVATIGISGCTAQRTEAGRINASLPGQLYGNGGATPCTDQFGTPIRCTVDGTVPICGYPADGDEWDPRNNR